MTFNRHLRADGVFNLRDAGNYPTQDGRMVQPKRLYRCGALHDLTKLDHLKPKMVLDLRRDFEVERDGVACGPVREAAGVQRVSLSLVPQEVEGVDTTAYLDSIVGSGMSAQRYFKYLEIGGANIRTAIELFAGSDVWPAVVHCTAGKDRTGVVVALLHDIVGVSRANIVEDYDLSNRAVPQLIEHMQKVYQTEHVPSESDLGVFGAPPEAMDGMLELLHDRHGSARGYLRSIGVADDVFESIERALLSPSP